VTHADTADLREQRAALVREIGTLKLLTRYVKAEDLRTTIRVLEWRIRQIDAEIGGDDSW